MYLNNKGENLIELIVVLTVGVIVIGALVFATISSLRNASLAKNHAQATKLAQEGIEKVRTGRDRNATINFGSWDGSGTHIALGTPIHWQDDSLWNNTIASLCGNTGSCYMKIINSNNLVWVSTSNNFPTGFAEALNTNQFERAVILSDDPSTYTQQKTVTVIVRWQDFAGFAESKLTTILRRVQ